MQLKMELIMFALDSKYMTFFLEKVLFILIGLDTRKYLGKRNKMKNLEAQPSIFLSYKP